MTNGFLPVRRAMRAAGMYTAIAVSAWIATSMPNRGASTPTTFTA